MWMNYEIIRGTKWKEEPCIVDNGLSIVWNQNNVEFELYLKKIVEYSAAHLDTCIDSTWRHLD